MTQEEKDKIDKQLSGFSRKQWETINSFIIGITVILVILLIISIVKY